MEIPFENQKEQEADYCIQLCDSVNQEVVAEIRPHYQEVSAPGRPHLCHMNYAMRLITKGMNEGMITMNREPSGLYFRMLSKDGSEIH